MDELLMKNNVFSVEMRGVAKPLFRRIQTKVAYQKSSNGLLIWPSMGVGFVIQLEYLISVPTQSLVS